MESVIVDEIHAVAGTKRGAHMAPHARAAGGQPAVDQLDPEEPRLPVASRCPGVRSVAGGSWSTARSASALSDPAAARRHRPLPRRSSTACLHARRDGGERKRLDLKIHVPVESMVEPDQGTEHLDPARAGAGRRIDAPLDLAGDLPGDLDLVEQHRSTSCSSTTGGSPSASRCGSTSWPRSARRRPRRPRTEARANEHGAAVVAAAARGDAEPPAPPPN